MSEAVAGFAHLYSYGIAKCKFLSELLWRPIPNLQDFNCPQPKSFNYKRWCSLLCHKIANINCVTKTAHSLYDCLMYHLQKKFYVECPKVIICHRPNLFRLFKTEQPLGCPITLGSTMSARRRRPDATETLSAATPKLVKPQEFDTYICYVEAVNLPFVLKRVLLKRIFFIDEDRTKYVSV